MRGRKFYIEYPIGVIVIMVEIIIIATNEEKVMYILLIINSLFLMISLKLMVKVYNNTCKKNKTLGLT